MTAEPGEHRRPGPRVPVDLAAEPRRQDALEVAEDAAAGHVGERVSPITKAADVVEIEPRRSEQVRAVVVLVLEHPPDKGEAVRVHAGGGESHDDVALRDLGAVDDRVPGDDSHARACKVELVLLVDTWQLGRLAADQGDAGSPAHVGRPLDELDDLAGVDGVRGHVVQEDERIGAARDDVVDAVGGEIGAAVAKRAPAAGEHELRAHRVGGRRQQPPVVERMQAGERAEAGGAGGLDGRPQAFDDVGALLDGDTGVVVRPPGHVASLFSAL